MERYKATKKQILSQVTPENGDLGIDESDDEFSVEDQISDLKSIIAMEFDSQFPDPEFNSDFDSDNDINIIDTFHPQGYNTTPGLTSQNAMK